MDECKTDQALELVGRRDVRIDRIAAAYEAEDSYLWSEDLRLLHFARQIPEGSWRIPLGPGTPEHI